MRSALAFITAASLLASPAAAHDYSAGDVRTGTFVGARLHVPIGGKAMERPHASLGIGPTLTRVSNREIRTRIGEGLALDLTPGKKVELKLAGLRADRALGLTTRNGPNKDGKNGISTGGWVAIGVGTVLIAGAVGFALWVDSIEDNED
jgi:hypothetical protein